MKKLTLFAALFMLFQMAFAGGILTNSNQSAQFVRLLSRNASTTFDAVYFNPAGLMKMDNGLYFAVHNQSLYQTRTITTTAPLNNKEFIGDVAAPVFPTAFAIYKMDNIAFSVGFGPNGGGGSADYKTGLPSFEGQVANSINGALVPAMAGLSALGYNVQPGYGVDISFEGTSVFWGIQGGVSAKINDIISGYIGVRYLPSVNTYNGAIKNIQMNVNGSLVQAGSWLTETSGVISGLAAQASAGAALLSGTAATMQPLIDGGAGTYTIAQVEGAGFIDAAKRAQIEGGLAAIGLTNEQIAGIDIAGAQTSFNTASATYAGQATLLTQTAGGLAVASTQVGDQAVETTQTGAGITPIIGVNISPTDNLNIGIKYEHKTSLALTNDTKVDDTGLFPDKAETHSDLPGILAVGVDFKPVPKLLTTVSYNMYFDKGVNWGNNIYGQPRTIDNNMMEFALGLQYNLTDNFAVSIGGLRAVTGVSEQYQSDFSYSNTTSTVGLGFEWKLGEKLTFDAGYMNTFYEPADKNFTGYSESYTKSTWALSFGIGYKIF